MENSEQSEGILDSQSAPPSKVVKVGAAGTKKPFHNGTYTA